MNNTKPMKSFLQAINEAIAEEMYINNNVFILGEDIGKYGGAFGVTRGLLEKFGSQRVIDTPISENSFVGLAAGAAMTGLRPVVEIMFMDFITLAMDQIVNHIAKFRYMYGGQVTVPIVIRTAAGAGRSYGASHSQSLESWFLHVPGLRIAVPSNPHDAKWLLKVAINDPNPWIFIENKNLYSLKGEIGGEIGFPVGTANIVQSGSDCTIITYSRMTQECLKMVASMKDKGIFLEIVDLRTLSPLDMKTVCDSIKKTRAAIIVEEGCVTGGVGAEISSRITEECFSYLSKAVLRIAFPDSPVPTSHELENILLPKSESIMQKIVEYLYKKM